MLIENVLLERNISLVLWYSVQVQALIVRRPSPATRGCGHVSRGPDAAVSTPVPPPPTQVCTSVPSRRVPNPEGVKREIYGTRTPRESALSLGASDLRSVANSNPCLIKIPDDIRTRPPLERVTLTTRNHQRVPRVRHRQLRSEFTDRHELTHGLLGVCVWYRAGCPQRRPSPPRRAPARRAPPPW